MDGMDGVNVNGKFVGGCVASVGVVNSVLEQLVF